MSSLPTPQTRLLISVANELGRCLDNIWGLRAGSRQTPDTSHQLPTIEASATILDNTELSLVNQWRLYYTHILATSRWTCAQLDQWLITPEYLGSAPAAPLPDISEEECRL